MCSCVRLFFLKSTRFLIFRSAFGVCCRVCLQYTVQLSSALVFGTCMIRTVNRRIRNHTILQIPFRNNHNLPTTSSPLNDVYSSTPRALRYSILPATPSFEFYSSSHSSNRTWLGPRTRYYGQFVFYFGPYGLMPLCQSSNKPLDVYVQWSIMFHIGYPADTEFATRGFCILVCSSIYDANVHDPQLFGFPYSKESCMPSLLSYITSRVMHL